MFDKIKITSLLIVSAMSTYVHAGELDGSNPVAIAAAEKYELIMDEQEGMQFWDLAEGFAPVYYGEMKNTSGSHLRCLALAFMHSPVYGKIHYVFKTWPANGSSCDYGDIDAITELGKPACLPDPTFIADREKGTRDMRPQTIGTPMKDPDGNYSRILDFTQYSYSKGQVGYGRAGLFGKCSHPKVDQGVAAKKGADYASGHLANTMRKVEIGNGKFFMQTNTRQYHVSLKWVNTADPAAAYPGKNVIPNRNSNGNW